ncbi:MAG TPA: hypothetical protein VK464_17335, partial [Symbiobacteriaceae bacterium]|nr:hypothetical protein [Symbiobacteriaceae bacterium]
MEPANVCPYPRCDGWPAPGTLRCPACRSKLLACTACGSLNRSMATYCRHCGGPLVPQDEWRMPRGDAAQSGYLPAAVCMPPVGGGAVGARRRSLRMAVDATMIAAYDYLFLPTQAHGLRVINVDTLEDVTTLESPFGNPLHLAPAVAGGAVYVASPFGLACYDLTRTLGAGGNLRPTLVGEPVRAKEHILTSPLVVGEHVVFGTEGGVQRLTPGGTQAAPQPLAFGKASLLARHGDCLVFSPDGESLAAVDLAGALRW